jgi:WD40 repeat protein
LQDLNDNSQTVLQGHTQPIACVCTTLDGSLVLTADAGPDSMLIAWNTATGEPTMSLPKPHNNGVLAMDMTRDGQLLVTISDPGDEDAVQDISLWDLSIRTECKNLITVPIPAGDIQVRSCVDVILSRPQLISKTRAEQSRPPSVQM